MGGSLMGGKSLTRPDPAGANPAGVLNWKTVQKPMIWGEKARGKKPVVRKAAASSTHIVTS